MTDIFNLSSYYSCLRTKRLGRPCLYLETVDSTIDLAIKERADTLVLAREQTRGRGQRTNVWHSPVGCAMGSVRMACLKPSMLAKRLSFLQHLVAMAVVKTLEGIDQQKLGPHQIGLKWPNDIIYTAQKEHQKIGGILVNTIEQGEEFELTLSFGVNIFNKEPTTCVSEIIGSTDKLSISQIVAEIMNNIEQLTYDLDNEKFAAIKTDYEKRCTQINRLIEDEQYGPVKVVGVNDDGYLIGEKPNQELCTVTKII